MSPRRAFTLIEVIVVTVMVAMLAVVLVTRLTGAATREFDLATERVSDLLLMYAIRSEFADEPVGIRVNPDRNSVTLVIRRGTRDDAFDGWTPDPSVPEVILPDFIQSTDLAFHADGDPIDPSDRPLTSLPGQPRPRVDVLMRSGHPRLSREVKLVLPPNAWRPVLSDTARTEQNATISRTAVDLDTSGRWQEDW